MSNKEHSRGPQHGLILPRSRCFNTGYLKRFGGSFAAADIPSIIETHAKNLRKDQQMEFVSLSFATKIPLLSFLDDCFLIYATVNTVRSCSNDSQEST